MPTTQIALGYDESGCFGIGRVNLLSGFDKDAKPEIYLCELRILCGQLL